MGYQPALCLAFALTSLALAGAPARAEEAGDPVVAQRGEVRFTASDVRRMIAAADPAQREALLHDPALLASMVRQRLLQLVLLRQAHAEGWDAQPQVRYRADLARDAAIAGSYLAARTPLEPGFPSEEQVRAAYEVNKPNLILPPQYRLAQIFIAVPPAGEGEARDAAATLRRQIAGGADFARLAASRSDDKGTAGQGGELGWRRADALPPPVRAAVANLQPGGVSEPVRTPDGWRIFKLLGVKPGGPASYADAHEMLVRALREQKSVQDQSRYLDQLLQQQPMSLDDVALAKAAQGAGP
jgi:hypothetical protein